MTVFEFNDYKKYLQQLIHSNSVLRGYQTKLAEAIGCQRAFISQILHGKAHFTADQAVKACQFWQFRKLEVEYFLELVQYAKAGSQELRAYGLNRLETLKGQNSELSSKIRSTGKLSEEEQSVYYSNWLYAAIHVLTSIPSYRTESAIAQRLLVPLPQVSSILSQLEKMKLVSKRSGKWQPTEKNLFLPRQSHMHYMHHSNWKLQALGDIQKNIGSSIHFSTLHALSIKDAEVLRMKVLEFIQESKALVEPSPEEDMVCLCLDYFRI